MTDIPIKSTKNSSNELLDAGGVFPGEYEATGFRDIMISAYSDVAGTITVFFSNDSGRTSYSSFDIPIKAGRHKFRVLEKGPRSVKISYTNGSTEQTVFDFSVYYGEFRAPSSPLNSVLSQDADALVTRSIGEELLIAEGKYRISRKK